MEVPVATSLNDIYPSDAVEPQTARWENLLASFKKEYGHAADFVSRSPGRVNLIGEHIDYSLYEVLPMAVTVDILLAVKVTRTEGVSKIAIANVNEKFPKREFEVPADGDVEIDASSLEWSNYFKAGLKGAAGLLRKKYGSYVPVNLEILADGTVPAGGGLSSSAAFCCASTLAVLRATGEKTIGKKELTELAIVSERAVGVNSGGMDQSASVFGQRGSALYVSFTPTLKATPVSFPDVQPEMTFVVAQSFVQADKHTTGPIHYNLRVVECSLAAVVLAKIFRLADLPKDSSPLGVSLRSFQDAFFKQRGSISGESKDASDFAGQLEDLSRLVEDYLLQEEGYTRDQLAEILGVPVEEIEGRFMSKFPVRAERFMLRQRALHVFREATRVAKFKALLDNPPAEGLLKDLGALMNETQDSCRDIYDCSCPELDEMCRLARAAGSYGSRLTGAGWGGCSVHLVPKDKVEAVKQAWIEKYYKKRWPDISDEKLKDAIVVSKPSSGSFLFQVTGDKVV
ncbi:galactokinase [Verruconis gallopava]|uniref:Galactokinase n=1 Tax=Verruconis gallopava TaxID=253628 RepID=A0A0D2ANR2_9PEZI|nr:galactokinase [Verruconis gallopava]KIW08165.1 galactokinase [Verruconis gallopava]